ncbi:hypothetical protein Asi02nite_80210 [Asanoa siamensis]|uniref:DDE superfamily endonuclease n=1 Tax=Asanoa siamensis TaxID=926357 RepID=A0ABQ4D5F9_9ACTN|nr:hypothetical protein Asi02nite_80210 [Asanoa siamensis]
MASRRGTAGTARPGAPPEGDTYTWLAAGFGVGVTTAWRYVQQAIALLAAAADDLAAAMDRVRRLAYAMLGGTLIPIDRVADQNAIFRG